MKTLHILAAVAIAVGVASCSGRPEISYIPAVAEGDQNWGLIDARGEFLFTDEFENRPSAVVNGYFFVEEGDGYSVYKAEKSPRPVGDLTGLKDCGLFNEGVMPVVHPGEHITFVDGKGNVKFTLDDVDGVSVDAAANMFVNGRCAFRTSDDKWGAVDAQGNVVIEPKYEYNMIFVSDEALVKDINSGKWVIIDRNGNEIAEIKENIKASGFFIDGYTCVQIEDDDDDSRYAMVDTKGELTMLPRSVREVYVWNDRYVVFGNNDYKFGIMTYDGETKVRAKYNGIELLPNGRFIAERDGKVMYVNVNGDVERLRDKTEPALRYTYALSKIFDFKFELITCDSDGDEYEMCDYSGETHGEEMERYKGRIRLNMVYSDYYDYEAVTRNLLSLFDANGLSAYPFGSQMSRYVDPSRSTEWYRGDRSLSVNLSTDSRYFYVSSLTLSSDNNIVYDSTPYASYYTWSFNPESRVDSFTLALKFYGGKYREDLPERLAAALSSKYGVSFGGDNSVTGNGYDTVTLKISRSGWGLAPAAQDVEAVDSAAVDTCFVEEVIWVTDSVM
ncbi:MAG: WG repeat-containing protein [Muribaculaceae bacterium]|nr:WG repeat-containing protein [Muribaculaceae bacterium]